jgi:hypothetical protein
MGASGLTMVSAGDYSVPDDQNGADRGIRACLPESLSRLRKRAAHEPFIVVHLEINYSMARKPSKLFRVTLG